MAAYYVTVILSLVVWAVVTTLHFVLTARVVFRLVPPRPIALDERAFAAVLGGVVSLAAVLHVVALTAGLGLWPGIAGLALLHAAMWPLGRAAAPVPEDPAAEPGARDPILDTLALAVLFGIGLTWAALAPASADVLGADAAHYHVPAALNLAQGASPFDLPATSHLYPLTGSMVAAWFIVPVGTPLIVDLAMVLPWALMVVALNVLFRCATRLSGTAWATWFSLALFSMPMFRMSSLGGADLWFASGFVACVAAVVQPWTRGRATVLDILLVGGACGLLVGSKPTGAPAAVLLILAFAIVALIRPLAYRFPVLWPSRAAMAWTGAVMLGVGAGGIWLIRNWVQFGSPLAPSGVVIAGYTLFAGEPFERSRYLSVLAELETDSFDVVGRLRHYVALWFGPWYLAALAPIAIYVADLMRIALKSGGKDPIWARLILFVVTVGVGGALAWLLIGAPWTGLERNRGLSLRYLLPIAALLPLLAYLGVFALSGAWYARGRLRLLAAPIVLLGSLWLFRRSLIGVGETTALAVPDLDGVWFAAALAGVIAARLGLASRAAGRAVVLVSLAAGIAFWVPFVAGQDRWIRADAEARLAAELDAFVTAEQARQILGAAPEAPGRPLAWREVFLAVRLGESATARACTHRRFFVLTRFDEPLALQAPNFGSRVFYAARDENAARRAGPLGVCDYVVTTPLVAGTTKGQGLAWALAGGQPLRTVATTRDFLVLAVGETAGGRRP